MRKKYIDFYMDVARRTAQLSYAKKLKVGSIIVKDDSIISYGYNGTPPKWDNVAEDKVWLTKEAASFLTEEEIETEFPYVEYSDYDPTVVIGRYYLKTRDEVIHAEMNSLAKLAKSSFSGKDSIMFITHSPCLQCAKGIYTAGISEIYYQVPYKCDHGIEFLNKCGVKVVKV